MRVDSVHYSVPPLSTINMVRMRVLVAVKAAAGAGAAAIVRLHDKGEVHVITITNSFGISPAPEKLRV